MSNSLLLQIAIRIETRGLGINSPFFLSCFYLHMNAEIFAGIMRSMVQVRSGKYRE